MPASAFTRYEPADIHGKRVRQGDGNVDSELGTADAPLESGQISARQSGAALDFLLTETEGNTQALDPAGDLLSELHDASLATTRPAPQAEHSPGGPLVPRIELICTCTGSRLVTPPGWHEPACPMSNPRPWFVLAGDVDAVEYSRAAHDLEGWR